MDLLTNAPENVDSIYVSDYPPIGIEPYVGITEEDLNPVLDDERMAYYENHFSKKYFDDEDDPICGEALEEDDLVFLKRRAATQHLQKVESCIKQYQLILGAIKSNPKYISQEDHKNTVIPLTIMVTPARAWDVIYDSQRDLEELLRVSKQMLEEV